MKRFLFVLAVVFVTILASSSCKTHETCPAYGAADTTVELNEAQL